MNRHTPSMAPVSSTSKRPSDGNSEMSPETARKLFDNGGVLIVLHLPIGSVFGIDMKVYQVGEKFRGLKMIPPGLHFIYYSAVSKEGCVAPRTGFFHYFEAKEIVIKKWDSATEDLNAFPSGEEELQRIRASLPDLDRNLGAYPYQNLKQWNRLTCNISDALVKKFEPLNKVISSVTQLIPLNYPALESKEPDSTSEKKHLSLEDRFLPDMKKVPGTEIRFTEIPKVKYPAGSTASQITTHSMDSTYVVEQLLQTYDQQEDILGELQMAHICFLIAHVYDAFEHWKKLVQLLCSMDCGIAKYSDITKTFMTVLHYQLKEIPTDFFVDITSEDNFLVSTLQVFFENVKNSEAEESFKNFANNFRKHLTTTFKWDFEGVPDDEQPVIVEF